MQDMENLSDGECKPISRLLIDFPGEKTKRDNTDHFVKQGTIERICTKCIASALFTLQVNAPSGGVGHRTSLRGGGPLTTLVVFDEQRRGIPVTLWRNVWLNVLTKQELETLNGSADRTDIADIFPWMAKTRTSEAGSGKITTPLDVSPLQMYWGMPRRIRINLATNNNGGYCDLCGMQSDKLVAQYQTKNYGVNYKGAWQHPLSPYKLIKGEFRPQHAQPGGLTYQHWLGLTEDQEENHFSAKVVQRYRRLAENWEEQVQVRLYVFGYDTKQDKARCWYETTYPLYFLPNEQRLDFAKRVQTLTETAAQAADLVSYFVKQAWFQTPKRKGDVSFLKLEFYQRTNSEFYQAVKTLSSKHQSETGREILKQWHVILCKAALKLFDDYSTRGDFTRANPARIANARSRLIKGMNKPQIRTALQLS